MAKKYLSEASSSATGSRKHFLLNNCQKVKVVGEDNFAESSSLVLY